MTMTISQATPAEVPRRFEAWQASLRTSHEQFSHDDSSTPMPAVRDVLAAFAPLYCHRDRGGAPYVFHQAARTARGGAGNAGRVLRRERP
jgi:putative acetyltransferase